LNSTEFSYDESQLLLQPDELIFIET